MTERNTYSPEITPADIDQILKGNIQLCRKLDDFCFGLAMRIIGERNMAEEISQEVMVKLWCHDKLSTYDSKKYDSPKAWIAQIVSNAYRDKLRKIKRRENIERRAMSFATPVGNPIREVDGTLEYFLEDKTTKDIADKLAEKEEYEIVSQELDQLRPDRARMISNCYLRGLTYEQIAELEDVALGTVKSKLSFSKEKLRERIVT